FGGLPELIEKFLQEIAGASDIPVTRLLGQSPGGLNSTGESDLRNYYDRVNADQTLTISPALAKLDELIICNALGSRPASIHYNWNSLWQP
ncbi:anti-CBASS protein Acb1 family protein, partial [Streptomyces sp. P17]|uniref:anti-CBASS protein Acb1 family protein n=1 Tax=Streptomyces sp. P17 TaxID=3074716 RepID=UPI0028F3F8F5